ncbi:ATP-binding protein [Streptomyces hoynatensis]|uniref:histidine kinase n=1 Tax=Streptomyces hoynatensis TaxID=1141874 RepID=A0A3A9YSB8_9ACTN|nr:ATP-binding protein [Streptomyces hoynatensis]RKN38951.1 ATP-binding protein [Streptomyces hoynatensis]
MTQYIQDPALWGLIVGTPLAATVIYQGRKTTARLRKQKDELESRHTELQNNFTDAVDDARLRAEEATKSALKSAMRTLQGLANEQQLAISKVQDKYGDQHILEDLLEIDHMNSQFGRRAQSVAVLCDGWLGRQRAVASVYDVARSAKGRIRHYTRVEVRSQSNFAIISRAVEPVALVLAELLDNATSYSAPETTVEINIRSVPKGVCVIVDDAGVGMNEEEKTRAARLLSGEHPVGVTELGNPPQFGFAVIGVLAARYGFSVSVDSSSPYGGVRAVVLLPQELLTSMPEQENSPASEEPAAEAPREQPATTAGGLPKRRRRGQMAIVPQARTERGTVAARSSEETASIMGAFQRGTQSGRSADSSRTEPSREGHEVQ